MENINVIIEVKKSADTTTASTPMYQSERSNEPAIGRFWLNRQDMF